MAEITRELASWIHAYLDYNPETGVFTWLVDRGTAKIGDTAGSVYSCGYRYIQIEGQDYRAGRLAWFMVTGEDTLHLLDHKDGNKSNDTFDNLRLASHSENQANAFWKTNTSGIKGIRYQASRKKWIAIITVNGKAKNLGRFTSMTDAAYAYKRAAIDAWGEFAKVPSDDEIAAIAAQQQGL